MAPIVKTRPHQVFFSPPGTTEATCMGKSRNRRMNHLKLVANQNAEMRKYQAFVSWNTCGESSSGGSLRTMVTSMIRRSGVQALGRSGVSSDSDGWRMTDDGSMHSAFRIRFSVALSRYALRA